MFTIIISIFIGIFLGYHKIINVDTLSYINKNIPKILHIKQVYWANIQINKWRQSNLNLIFEIPAFSDITNIITFKKYIIEHIHKNKNMYKIDNLTIQDIEILNLNRLN